MQQCVPRGVVFPMAFPRRDVCDILGYKCSFDGIGCGHFYRSRGHFRGGFDSVIYGVSLNEIFVGTIQIVPSHGWILVVQLPDGSVGSFRGSSRVKAVTEYVRTCLLS